MNVIIRYLEDGVEVDRWDADGDPTELAIANLKEILANPHHERRDEHKIEVLDADGGLVLAAAVTAPTKRITGEASL